MIVVWRITEHCNLGCKFCAYDREVERLRRTADITEIERFGSVLAEHQYTTGETVLVSWLGGEPLLWPPLTKLSELFTREFHLQVSTTTNGTTLSSAAVRAHLLAHYAELTVSVDATGEVYDRLRGWPGGFLKLRESVRRLVAERRSGGSSHRLRVNTVLMRHTIAGFPRLCRELAGWGVDEITFNQLGGRDRPEFFPAHRLTAEQVDRFATDLPVLRSQLAAQGVRLQGGEGYLARFRATARGERLRVADCHPGRSVLFVDERGRVTPCSFTSDSYGVPIRELRNAQDLRALPGCFAASRRARCDAACEDCHSTQMFEKFAPV